MNHAADGAVHILYGTATGIVVNRSGTALDDQYFKQGVGGVPDPSKTDDFGSGVLLADVNGDGCSDLLVTAIDAVGSWPYPASGSITVLYGSPQGIRTAGAQVIKGSTFPTTLRSIGEPITVGDLNHDGIGDLVTSGVPSQGKGPQRVGVVYGSRSGLGRGALTAEVLDNASLGLFAGSLRYDPSDLVTGDFDGDGKVELVVGERGRKGVEGEAAVVRRTATGWVKVTTISSNGVGEGHHDQQQQRGGTQGPGAVRGLRRDAHRWGL